MNIRKINYWVFICFCVGSLLFSISTYKVNAAEEEKSAETLEVKAQKKKTIEKITEKQDAIQEAVDATEIILEKKNQIEEEAKLIEREAALIQKEAALLKEEAKRSKDKKIKKKAIEAEKQAKELTKEAMAANQKLFIVKDKVQLAQEKIARDKNEIAALKKELYELKLHPGELKGITKWMNQPLFYIGDSPVTLGGVGSAIFIIFLALFISAVIQRMIIGRLTKASRLRSGVIYAIGRVVHYLIIILATVLAAQCVGLNLGSLAAVFGFLSVGIGFGLQNITSNFISGLILLFERPIGVGDFVTVDEQLGTVMQINMRSSLIETQDNIHIIVPNSKFIEGHVTNWSHGSTKVRIHCPIGVAYGSDVPKVKETLINVAHEHKDVLKNPAPIVRFLSFGDSSLDFDLLFWINEPRQQFKIHSDINYRIDAAFRENNIQIPFPQRDLYIKSSNAKL